MEMECCLFLKFVVGGVEFVLGDVRVRSIEDVAGGSLDTGLEG